MSQPRHAKRTANRGPAPDPAPYQQPTADGDHAAGRSRGLHAVPDPLPAPDPKEPPTPGTGPWPGCQLTQWDLSWGVPGDPDFIPGDPDQLLEEDFDRFVKWDRAIDYEPELE